MSDNLPGSQSKVLLIIFGIVLVLLSVEGVFLVLVRNKNRGSKVESQKKEAVSEEKITSVPTGIKNSGGDKKITLIGGKVSSFDVNDRKIDLILGDEVAKTIEIDDKTLFVYGEIGEKLISPSRTKIVNALTFWEGLKRDDKIGYSLYEGSNLADFIVKYIVD